MIHEKEDMNKLEREISEQEQLLTSLIEKKDK